MSINNLTDEEVDRVLLQLLEQTAPDRPTDAEAHALLKWAENVRIEQRMLELILAGDATARIVDGEARFKLTPQGMAGAEALMSESPQLREYHDQLIADAVGKPLGKPPKDPQ